MRCRSWNMAVWRDIRVWQSERLQGSGQIDISGGRSPKSAANGAQQVGCREPFEETSGCEGIAAVVRFLIERVFCHQQNAAAKARRLFAQAFAVLWSQQSFVNQRDIGTVPAQKGQRAGERSEIANELQIVLIPDNDAPAQTLQPRGNREKNADRGPGIGRWIVAGKSVGGIRQRKTQPASTAARRSSGSGCIARPRLSRRTLSAIRRKSDSRPEDFAFNEQDCDAGADMGGKAR